MKRALVAAALVAAPALVASADGSSKHGREKMTDAILKMCDFVMQKEQKAAAVAGMFGMHLHDFGDDANITFTPRDRRFSDGNASRRWKSQALNDLELTVAKDSRLTFGEMRQLFGAFSRSEGEHYDDPPRWMATVRRADRPLACDVSMQLVDAFGEGTPPDAALVKSLSLIPYARP